MGEKANYVPENKEKSKNMEAGEGIKLRVNVNTLKNLLVLAKKVDLPKLKSLFKK